MEFFHKAMTKCKECKKEVSNKAKTCPHCGVKEPGANVGRDVGQGLVGLIVVVVLYLIYGGDDDKNTQPEKTAEVKECAASDGQCLFDRYMPEAAYPCKKLVEQSSKYDFEWTDGFLVMPDPS